MVSATLGFAALVMFAIAIIAPCLEVYSQHRWPRATLLPSGVAMVIGFLLLAITL